jgi:hypothetical protein
VNGGERVSLGGEHGEDSGQTDVGGKGKSGLLEAEEDGRPGEVKTEGGPVEVESVDSSLSGGGWSYARSVEVSDGGRGIGRSKTKGRDERTVNGTSDVGGGLGRGLEVRGNDERPETGDGVELQAAKSRDKAEVSVKAGKNRRCRGRRDGREAREWSEPPWRR